MQLEKKIDEISDFVKSKISVILQEDFGINLKRLDIATIELDKEHEHYQQLKFTTADQQTKNIDELNRIQRKDIEMGVEGKNFGVHQLNQQTDVLKTAAENLGQMGNVNLGGGAGMNSAGIMMGLGIGSAMGNQMSGMMNNITQQQVPPPPPILAFHISLNGQQSGPFNLEQLKQFAQSGQFTKNHHVWKEGMTGWELASIVQDLTNVFPIVPPPPPPI